SRIPDLTPYFGGFPGVVTRGHHVLETHTIGLVLQAARVAIAQRIAFASTSVAFLAPGSAAFLLMLHLTKGMLLGRMRDFMAEYGGELGFAGQDTKHTGIHKHRSVGEGMRVEVRILNQVELE